MTQYISEVDSQHSRSHVEMFFFSAKSESELGKTSGALWTLKTRSVEKQT